MKKCLSVLLWTYRKILLLYPARVRSEYGDEMEQVFAQGCREAAHISPWALARLAWVELWDLPANLVKEHWEDQRKYSMNAPIFFSLPRAVARGSLAFGLSFLLINFVFSLVDSLVNGGQTLGTGHSIWMVTWLRPGALACAAGAFFVGFGIRRGKVIVSAAACLVAYWFLAIAGNPIMNPPRQPQNLWTGLVAPFLWMAVVGAAMGGLIGWLQHGRKHAGLYALTGAGGFLLGWLMDRLISSAITILLNPTMWLSDIVVGSLPYFVYFLLPVFIRGLIIGLCFGLATPREEFHFDIAP